MLHISSIEFFDQEPVAPPPRDYRQECIDRVKAARARMAKAALRARTLPSQKEIQAQLRAKLKADELARQKQINEDCAALAAEQAQKFLGRLKDEGKVVRQLHGVRRALEIRRAVIAASSLTLTEIMAERRCHKIVRPRQFAMWWMRRDTILSLPRISRLFNKLDHSTTFNACRKIDAMLADGSLERDWPQLFALIPQPEATPNALPPSLDSERAGAGIGSE